MLVLRPDGEVTEKQARDLAQKMAGEEATVATITLLGKKQLAYPIKKLLEGTFVLAILEAKGIHTADVEKRVQSEEKIIRFLLTQKEG